MSKTYANSEVLKFYQNLQFNIYSDPKLSADQIKKNNPTKIYNDLNNIIVNSSEFKLLDVGCGAGWFINSMKYYYNKIDAYGVDFNQEALRFGEEVSLLLKLDTKFICEDLFSINLKKKFDLITSIGVLHHTNNCLAGIQKLIDLEPKYLMIGLYHKYGRKPFLDHFDNLKKKNKELDKNELEELLYREFILLDKRSKDETHKRSWFFDQVLHPYETQHTLEEIVPIISNNNYQLISTSLNKFDKKWEIKELIKSEKKQTDIGNEFLRKQNYYPGFFIIFLKKTGI